MARSSRLVSLGLGLALTLLGINGAGFQVNTGRATENQQRLAQSCIHQTQLTFWGINGVTALLLTLMLYWIWHDRRDQIEIASPPSDQSFSPLEADLKQSRPRVEVPSIDLIHILEDSLRHLTGLLHDRDAEVRVARPLPVVQCDRSILFQVFTTLIRHALNQVPPGFRPVIKIYAEASPAWAYLWIEDNGGGVALEYQDRRDWTLDRGHEDETDGGIGVGGLTIVRQTLQSIGGQVGVEPLTQGSRFWIALPVRTACPYCAPDGNGSSSKT